MVIPRVAIFSFTNRPVSVQSLFTRQPLTWSHVRYCIAQLQKEVNMKALKTKTIRGSIAGGLLAAGFVMSAPILADHDYSRGANDNARDGNSARGERHSDSSSRRARHANSRHARPITVRLRYDANGSGQIPLKRMLRDQHGHCSRRLADSFGESTQPNASATPGPILLLVAGRRVPFVCAGESPPSLRRAVALTAAGYWVLITRKCAMSL